MKFEWETLEIKDATRSGGYISKINITSRTKVPGGWILKSKSNSSRFYDEEDGGNTQSESMAFIPDPNHEWAIDKND